MNSIYFYKKSDAKCDHDVGLSISGEKTALTRWDCCGINVGLFFCLYVIISQLSQRDPEAGPRGWTGRSSPGLTTLTTASGPLASPIGEELRTARIWRVLLASTRAASSIRGNTHGDPRMHHAMSHEIVRFANAV